MPPDVGLDAPIDAGPPDTPTDPCPPIGAVLEVDETSCPELDRGMRWCVRQDACELDVVEPDGTITSATITMRELELSLGGIDCEWTLDELGGASLQCRDSGGIACTATLRGIALSAAPACCLPGDATCGATAACTLVARAGDGPIAGTACVERTGEVAEGESCARTEPGRDDCAAGLFCTALGASSGERVCQRLCREDADCAAGDRCTDSGAVPSVGVCAPPCDPFAATPCGDGLACQPLVTVEGDSFPACAAEGSGAAGERCDIVGCIAGLVCPAGTAAERPRCRTWCDTSHACTGTDVCEPLASGGSFGACVPAP